VAYKNPDGKIVLVVQNSSPDSQQVAINLDGRKIKPILPAHSVSTFVTDWSVYSKAFYKIQARITVTNMELSSKGAMMQEEKKTLISLVINNRLQFCLRTV